MKEINCKACGKWSRNYGGYCQGCYRYFKDGGTINEKPPKGVITYDNRGFVICHICGRAYRRLGSHVRESHGMTIEEYKAEFGLCANSRTTESEYHNVMRKHALDNDMDKQLLRTGMNTRVKKGENKLRKGKPIRLMETLEKRSRRYKEV